ncbi:MAG: nucleoside-diphosphate kinase [Lentisphaerae bacterium GWF2_45_14]|nr:MAG: nucleoside-diphosphate kinase [Lentisphaerae bacterium GWF2_45_14]
MAEEISYVIITPYSLMKSRTGGIMARLLSRTDLELVAAKILAPSAEFAYQYAQLLENTIGKHNERAGRILADYVRENFSPLSDGRRERILMLLFKGEDACRKLYTIVGGLPSHREKDTFTGETIRDTYADLIINPDGAVKHFEPAVLTPPDEQSSRDKLKLFMDFAEKEPNVVENIAGSEDTHQRTLTIIKPENWRHPSTKPGNIIDIFSRTGLRIVGCKLYQMSIAEALEFYGPVQGVLRKKFATAIAEKVRGIIESELGLKLDEGVLPKLTDAVGLPYADDQFYQIIEFMSGSKPCDCPESDKGKPGKVKCLVLIYEGKDAVTKIREVLGPTDPSKAPSGTVRSDFGRSVMVNTAHASDSPENAQREMKIVKIDSNDFCRIIKNYLEQKGN